MNTAKKKRLEAGGWKVGTTTDFLGLSREEAELVEVKLALSDLLKRRRTARRLSQESLAGRIGSSQSRIAKLEAGRRGTTLDLLFRALLATGMTRREIGQELQHKKRRIA